MDVVIRKGAAVLELLTSEDQTLLVGGDTLLVWFMLVYVFEFRDGRRRGCGVVKTYPGSWT